MKSPFRRLIRGTQGQALVESAVVLPVLLVVIFGIAQFGLTYNNYLMLTDAVRVGARTLVTNRGQNVNPCLVATTKLKNASTLNQSNITVSMVVNSTTYAGTCNNIALVSGADVTVTATYPCNLTVFGIDFAPSCTLSSQATERIE